MQAACPFFAVCGGCETQDIPYPEQVAQKQAALERLFEPIAGQISWQPIISSPDPYPLYFRNKIRYGFVVEDGMVSPSRHSKGSEEADIAVDTCLLQSDHSMELALFTAKLATERGWEIYSPQTGKGWLKHILIREGKRTGECLVSLVTDNRLQEEADLWATRLLEAYPETTSVYQTLTWGKNNENGQDRHLAGKERIEEKVGDFRFYISPHAFFQTNGLMVETLYNTVLNSLGKEPVPVLWDLYAGSATIGIYAHHKAGKVVSIESNPRNLEDALINLEANQVANIELIEGKVEDLLDSAFIRSHERPSAIILDPPRAGLAPRLKNLLPALKPHKLVYVSCNPLTCLRDCRELLTRGYKLESLQGLDLFPHTHHCEMIAMLSIS